MRRLPSHRLSAALKSYASTVQSVRQAESVSKRWPIYAAATGAALAAVTSADATMITGFGATVGPGSTPLVVTAPGSSGSFSAKYITFGSLGKLVLLANYKTHSGAPAHAGVHLIGLSSARVLASQTSYGTLIRRLNSGDVISTGPSWRYGGTVAVRCGCGSFYGQFLTSGATGLAGFQLSNGDLGWIRIQWNSTLAPGFPNQITAFDWAFSDQPGLAVYAGGGEVPEPGTLPLSFLAAGAVGIAAWKRRRRAAVA